MPHITNSHSVVAKDLALALFNNQMRFNYRSSIELNWNAELYLAICALLAGSGNAACHQ